MTLTQRILAKHANLPSVTPGQLIEAKVDLALGNDVTAPVAIKEFDKSGGGVFDQSKIALVPDHFTPNKDIKSAEHCKIMRDFACKHAIENYFEIGEMGIEHCLLPEKGLVVAGDLVIGADSHTCTYGALSAFSTGVGSTDLAFAMKTGKAWFKVPSAIKFVLTGKLNRYVSGKDLILHIIGMIGVDGALYQSMEFFGEGLQELSMDARLTIANMAIEAGAKNGIFPYDEKTEEYLKEHINNNKQKDITDIIKEVKELGLQEEPEDQEYEQVIHIDLSTLKPTVSKPHLPSNTVTVDQIEEIKLDQVVIGSCTNGRIEDLRVAAEIMKGKKAAKGVRVIILPGTQKIYLDALKEGIIETLVEAGAAVSTPTCGPCLGGHMGILAAGEVALATTNRNFVGRMGSPDAFVYLASPAVAAASALVGKIVAP